MNTPGHPRHLFNIESMNRDEILQILDAADRLRKSPTMPPLMANKVAGLVFLQPSTRTRVGFDVAVKRLGGNTTVLGELKQDQGMGGAESLEDTLRVISAYCDLLIVRHPHSVALQRALPHSSVPVINAGSGCEQHPTQTLIDLWCIRARLGRLDRLRIGLVGDLVGSRSARSLVKAMAYWPPAKLRLMAPEGRSLDGECISGFAPGVVEHYSRLVPADLDILYVAQLPNAPDAPPYDISQRTALGVTLAILAELPDHAAIMCPLPRLDEIDRDVDSSPKVAYFAQSDGALYVRSALVAQMTSQDLGWKQRLHEASESGNT